MFHLRPPDQGHQSSALIHSTKSYYLGQPSVLRRIPSAPSTPAGFCLKHDGGDKFHTFNETAATWEHGFDIGGDVGIKGVDVKADFDPSTQTGYDANTELWFHFVKVGYLCGTNGYESDAAVLVARGTKT